MNTTVNTKTYRGEVARFKQAYGFIFCEELRRKIFFHFAEYQSAHDPVIGQAVTFELVPDDSKPNMPDKAVNVVPVQGGLDATEGE
jgi:cold shock CspA family protein